MTADNDLDVRRREAASWFATLNQKRVAASDITAFSQWRRTPANAEAYARIETMWEAAGSLKGDADIAALTAGARARADASRKLQGRLAKGLIPIGAVAAVAAVVVGVTMWSARPLSYETGLGERRIVVLADGSGARTARDLAIGEAVDRSATDRLEGLETLRRALDTAPNARAVMDLNARLAAEQALIQNEQVRLQGLALTQAAEARLEEQRARERIAAERSARMDAYRQAFQ